MNEGKALDWGICGVGVMPFDVRMKQVMDEQDCLYTLVLKHPDGTWEPRVIGSIIEYLFAPDDPDAVIEKMADPATRIVSLTVTEGGYNFHQVTGEFDAENPAVAADLVPGAVPRHHVRADHRGAGAAAGPRYRRRSRSCPATTSRATATSPGRCSPPSPQLRGNAWGDEGLGDWVQQNVPFPNSMVDRITPATTDQDRADIAERFGITDGWPVVCEPFTQWVLEDHFGTGRPPLRGGRGATGRRRRAVRADEAAAAQRQPPGPLLLRIPRRLPAGARSRPGPTVRRLPAGLHGSGGDADPVPRARHRPGLPTNTNSSNGSPTPGSGTPSPGSARRAPTGSRNGCSRWCGRTSPPAATSRCPPRSWPAGPATPKEPTNRATPSTSSIGSRTASSRRPTGNTTNRWHSSPTATSSVTWPTTSGSPALSEAWASLHGKGPASPCRILES